MSSQFCPRMAYRVRVNGFTSTDNERIIRKCLAINYQIIQ